MFPWGNGVENWGRAAAICKEPTIAVVWGEVLFCFVLFSSLEAEWVGREHPTSKGFGMVRHLRLTAKDFLGSRDTRALQVWVKILHPFQVKSRGRPSQRTSPDLRHSIPRPVLGKTHRHSDSGAPCSSSYYFLCHLCPQQTPRPLSVLE